MALAVFGRRRSAAVEKQCGVPLLSKAGACWMFQKENLPSPVRRLDLRISRALVRVANGNQVQDVPGRSLSIYLWADHILS